MTAHYEMYIEHSEGWEFQGTCPSDSITLMAQLYSGKTTSRLLFVDTKLPRPLAAEQNYEAYIKGWLSLSLDNVEHVLIQSMFKGYPDILIIPKQEVLNGFKFNDFDSTGYSRTATAS